MSGPSSGAQEQATKILNGMNVYPDEFRILHTRIAEALQANFDLGHKSAGGAQYDKVPAMGGLLEVAIDQEEIDALGLVASEELGNPAGGEPCFDYAHPALTRFLEKISMFRSKQ